MPNWFHDRLLADKRHIDREEIRLCPQNPTTSSLSGTTRLCSSTVSSKQLFAPRIQLARWNQAVLLRTVVLTYAYRCLRSPTGIGALLNHIESAPITLNDTQGEMESGFSGPNSSPDQREFFQRYLERFKSHGERSKLSNDWENFRIYQQDACWLVPGFEVYSEDVCNICWWVRVAEQALVSGDVQVRIRASDGRIELRRSLVHWEWRKTIRALQIWQRFPQTVLGAVPWLAEGAVAALFQNPLAQAQFPVIILWDVSDPAGEVYTSIL